MFGLLGFSADGSHSELKPNYREIRYTYARVTMHLIKISKSLDIMSCVTHSKRIPDVPSWVPDFTCERLIRRRLTSATVKARRSSSFFETFDVDRLPEMRFTALKNL